jgi:uncharacterized membrane protein YfcA
MAGKDGELPFGQRATKEDVEWLDYLKEMKKKSPDLMESVARYFITVVTSIITLYTGAIALFKITPDLLSVAVEVMLIASIVCYAFVYFPRQYRVVENSPDDIKAEVNKMTADKYRVLWLGSILFLAGLLLGFFTLAYGSYAPQHTPSQAVQFVVADKNVGLMNNMALFVTDGTLRTATVFLEKTDDKTYLVKLDDNREVTFSKDLVQGIIYVNAT